MVEPSSAGAKFCSFPCPSSLPFPINLWPPEGVCLYTPTFRIWESPVTSVSPSALEILLSWPPAHVNLCFLGSHLFGSICQLLWACWLPPFTASSGISPSLLRGVDLHSHIHMFPTSFQGRHMCDSRQLLRPVPSALHMCRHTDGRDEHVGVCG